jgi:hypothetical protein
MEDLMHPSVQLLINSLMYIPTFVEASASASHTSTVIGKLISQNLAAKTQSVSSLAISSVLLSLRQDDETLTVSDLIDRYNNHPTVVATNEASGGVGSITFHPRVKIAVSNWVEKTTPESLAVVVQSTHDEPYELGPYGESFAALYFVWIGSKVKLQCDPKSALTPFEGELFINVNW